MSLKVWLPLNGNLDNQGLSDITVTNNGATVDNSGKIGKCYKFGTSSSYLELSNTMKDFTTEASLSLWVYINTWNVSYATVFQAGKGGQGWDSYIFGMLRNNNSSQMCFAISNGSTASNASYLTPNLDTQKWYHITFVYKTGHCLIYINGELYQDYTTAIVPAFDKITKTTIGVCNKTQYYQTDCKLNDIRIYDHALSEKEVKLLSQGLVCHYPLEGANNTLLPLGYQQLEYIESAGASYFNTEYKFNPETDSFKVEFKGNYTSNNGIILGNNGSRYTWLYYYSTSGIKMYMQQSSQQGISGIPADLNKHIAECKSKHYWIDGVDKGGFTETYTEHSTPMYMFSYAANTSYPFKGRVYFCSIERNGKPQRVYIPAKRLSDNAIGMYDVVNNTFNVSATDTPFTAGTVIDTPTTIYDCSGFQYNGTVNGNLAVDSDSPRYSVSTSFDSNNKYISTTSPTSSARSVSFWFKPTTISSGSRVVFADAVSKLAFGFVNTTTALCSTGVYTAKFTIDSLSVDTWYHIAIVKLTDSTSSDVRLYINSVEQTTRDANDAWSHNTGNLMIGKRNTGSSACGSISDFRMYSTILSAEDILELYQTSASIDNNGNMYAYEFTEVE